MQHLYIVVVLRQDGFLFKRTIKADRKKNEVRKEFTHNGHRYAVIPDESFFLKRSYITVDWRSPTAMLSWLNHARKSRGMLVYREPLTPEETLVHPIKGGMTPELLAAETISTTVIGPAMFKKLAFSTLYRNHIRKVKFGGNSTAMLMVIFGLIAVVLLVVMTQAGWL